MRLLYVLSFCGFVAIATRLEFLSKVSLQLLHILSFYGCVAIATLEFLMKVSLPLLHVLSFCGFVAIATRLEFLWFRCNCFTTRVSEEGFVAIATRLEFLRNNSLQLLHVFIF